MSVDGGPEYPATTDLAEVATGGVALVDEPIAFDVEAWSTSGPDPVYGRPRPRVLGSRPAPDGRLRAYGADV